MPDFCVCDAAWHSLAQSIISLRQSVLAVLSVQVCKMALICFAGLGHVLVCKYLPASSSASYRLYPAMNIHLSKKTCS